MRRIISDIIWERRQPSRSWCWSWVTCLWDWCWGLAEPGPSNGRTWELPILAEELGPDVASPGRIRTDLRPRPGTVAQDCAGPGGPPRRAQRR
jgi:hypothetical protein